MTVEATTLRRRFAAAAADLGAHQHVGHAFEQLHARYSEPHRAYHALSHVIHGLAVLDDVADTLTAPAEVELAFWFHDAVYATHPLARNEERSAEVAYAACLRMGMREPTARRVASMVRATKAHLAEDSDTAAMLDVDLAILGADPLAYATYEHDIRCEYEWMFLEGIYRMLRARILRGFLERPSIFVHPSLRERYEKAARHNLDGALRELEAKHDEVTLHATDEHVFSTRAARLVGVDSWSDLYFVTHFPATETSPALLGVSFGPFDDRALAVEVDAPAANGLVARLRSVPGYRHDLEARPHSPARLVYSRERCGRVETPLRIAAPGASSPYR